MRGHITFIGLRQHFLHAHFLLHTAILHFYEVTVQFSWFRPLTKNPEVLSKRHRTLAMKHLLRKQERSAGIPPASGEWNRLLTTKSSPEEGRWKRRRRIKMCMTNLQSAKKDLLRYFVRAELSDLL